jgi:hypothetical protein
MLDQPPGNEPFLHAHWVESRTELDRTVARYLSLERLALVATAAIWTILAATSTADWDPLIKWLPFLLNVPIALRAVALAWRVRTLEQHLAAVERHFAVPPELALESRRGTRRIGVLTVLAFWGVLLAATAVLPYYYIEQSTAPDNQDETSTSYRGPRAAAGASAVMPKAHHGPA